MILGLIDSFDNWLRRIPMKKDCTALDVVTAVMQHWILKYGKMSMLLSDGAGNMSSQLMTDVCKLLRIRKIQSSPRYPQGDGHIERVWPSVSHSIRCVHEQGFNWHDHVAQIAYAHNTAVHSATNYPPWLMRFGRMPEPLHGFLEGADELRPVLADEDPTLTLAHQMHEIFGIAEQTMFKRNPRFGRAPCEVPQSYSEGNLVLRKLEDPAKPEKAWE